MCLRVSAPQKLSRGQSLLFPSSHKTFQRTVSSCLDPATNLLEDGLSSSLSHRELYYGQTLCLTDRTWIFWRSKFSHLLSTINLQEIGLCPANHFLKDGLSMSPSAMKLVEKGLFASPSRQKCFLEDGLSLSPPRHELRGWSLPSPQEQFIGWSLPKKNLEDGLSSSASRHDLRGWSLPKNNLEDCLSLSPPRHELRGWSLPKKNLEDGLSLSPPPPWAPRMVSPQEQSRGRSLIVSAPP